MRHLILRSLVLLVLTILQVFAQLVSSPTEEATVDGGTVRMNCRVSGIPKTEVKWIKNNRELTGGRYTILESGELEIKNVNFLDTGIYTCQASSNSSHAEISGNLVVRRRTIITDKPEDYEVTAGSTSTFRCNAVTDSDLTLTINWLKNGEPIDFELEPRFTLSTDYSLRISKTTELDSGFYTCVARTELDEAQAQAALVVRDVPNPPRLVEVRCMDRDADVQWVSVGDNRAPILRYTIQFNTSFTPDAWENAHDYIPATEQTYNVPMTPGANYTFRVLAWNEIGASLPSSHSEVCTTEQDVPYKNPDNVQARGTDPQNIVISWDVMPQIEHNAPYFVYRVYYKQDIPGSDWIVQDISDWKQHSLQIPDQPTYRRYKIKVVAVNERGESRVSANEVIGYSGEGVPLQAPTNFRVVNVTGSTSAKLSWDRVPINSIQGNFQSYKIQTWTDKEGEEGMREFRIRKHERKQPFSIFVPNSKNYVRILVYNGRYNGPTSETLSFDTPEGIPGTVRSFDGFSMGSRALYLVWQKPEESNGILIGYKIYYQIVDRTMLGPLLERQLHVTNPEVTRFKLTGLEPNTKYRVHIRAMTKAGESQDYFIERTTRSAFSVPPDVPNFSWERISSDNETAAIRVTWLPSQGGNPGSNFFVKYKLKEETVNQETALEVNEDSIEVQGLTKGQVYVVSIIAVDGDHRTESLPQEIHTGDIGLST